MPRRHSKLGHPLRWGRRIRKGRDVCCRHTQLVSRFWPCSGLEREPERSEIGFVSLQDSCRASRHDTPWEDTKRATAVCWIPLFGVFRQHDGGLWAAVWEQTCPILDGIASYASRRRERAFSPAAGAVLPRRGLSAPGGPAGRVNSGCLLRLPCFRREAEASVSLPSWIVLQTWHSNICCLRQHCGNTVGLPQ